MGKKLIFLFFLILFALPFISAQPGVFQQFETGYELKVPSDDVWKVGQNFDVYIHVYNITNGLPINSGISCYLHLYNSTGDHIAQLTQTAPTEIFDYSFQINGGNITKETTNYIVQCNSSALGGFHSVPIVVTNLGVELNESMSILYIGLLALLVLIFVLNFVGMSMLPDKNQRDEEGKLLSISYLKYFRNTLWMSGYFLFVGIVYVASNLSFAFLQEELVAKVLFMIFHISLACSPIVVIVWIIWIFVSMFHDKQMQNLLNRGMFKEGIL